MSTCGRCDTPTAGATLCDRCSRTTSYALMHIADWTDDLDTIAAKLAHYGTGRATRGSVGQAVPLPVHMAFVSGPPPPGGTLTASASRGAQLRYDVRATIVAWTRTILDEQPPAAGPCCPDCLHVTCHTIRRRRPPADTVRSMCHYLDRTHRWWEGRDWAPTMLDELLDLERRLRAMIDRPPDRWYAGRCDCDAELYAEAGTLLVACRACGTQHDVRARREYLLTEAKDYLVTATEAAGALLAWTDYDGTEVNLVKRISEWRDRGRLEVQDVTSLSGRDRHLYRLGDIQELLIDHARNTQARRLRVLR